MILGAQAIVECLKKENVPVVFGYPGVAILPFYDSLRDSGIRHILNRTEQGAGHAASGFARISGRPGVCAVTSGPGATNLFTAIATAYSDSIPLVAITGQVPTDSLGRDVFQEVDTTGAAEPFTKYSYLLQSADDIGRVFKEAFHIASTGRRGPVLIDVPVDVQKQLVRFSYPKDVSIRGYKPRHEGHALQVRRVAEAVLAAKRPLLCIGGGVFLSGGNAVRLIREFCGKNKLPAVSTMMGIGALTAGDPLYFGMLGQSGAKTANRAVSESDLLVLVGARVGDRAIAKPAALEDGAKIIHIDIDAAEIGKNVGPTIPLVGDAAAVILKLLEHETAGEWSEWLLHLEHLRENEQENEAENPAKKGYINPNAFVRALCAKLPENSAYIADVGQNQIWSAKNYTARGRFLTTGGMGTMGYSIPAGIGAKLADPEKIVVAVCGDGAFQMSLNELATMRRHDISVKIAVMNNQMLGMVKEIQEQAGGRSFAVDIGGAPDLKLIADAYGIDYMRLDSHEKTGEALDAMLNGKGSFLLECTVDPDENTSI
ncbi:MAG: biosynthetic-type acetolactate synthase large subunit [Oscillospiraceae bacterium]|nr:biosynthetic-type acetolactate synthase large subunit [Oscillospiraceae bacterium]